MIDQAMRKRIFRAIARGISLVADAVDDDGKVDAHEAIGILIAVGQEFLSSKEA